MVLEAFCHTQKYVIHKHKIASLSGPTVIEKIYSLYKLFLILLGIYSNFGTNCLKYQNTL